MALTPLESTSAHSVSSATNAAFDENASVAKTCNLGFGILCLSATTNQISSPQLMQHLGKGYSSKSCRYLTINMDPFLILYSFVASHSSISCPPVPGRTEPWNWWWKFLLPGTWRMQLCPTLFKGKKGTWEFDQGMPLLFFTIGFFSCLQCQWIMMLLSQPVAFLLLLFLINCLHSCGSLQMEKAGTSCKVETNVGCQLPACLGLLEELTQQNNVHPSNSWLSFNFIL